MISAATGAMALLMSGLVRDHGLEYLFAASILCGVFQIIIGLLKLVAVMIMVSIGTFDCALCPAAALNAHSVVDRDGRHHGRGGRDARSV